MSDLEIREASNADEWELEGLASRFNAPYRVTDRTGTFQEVVRPGAFTRSLSRNPDVLLLVNHRGSPLARTIPSRTLTLTQTDEGLHVRARLAKDDPEAQSAVSKVKRDLIGQMSFGFRVDGKDGQRWSDDYAQRELLSVELNHGDVTICPWGASPTTNVAVRGAASTAQERRAMAEAIGYSVRGYAPSGLAVAEARVGKYAGHELAILGAKGQAFKNPDGHWSFPTADREDVENAVQSIGRAPEALRTAVRKYIYRRASAMGLGHLLPPTWTSAGTVRQFGSRSDSTLESQLRARLAAARPGSAAPAEAELRARVAIALARGRILETQLRRRTKAR